MFFNISNNKKSKKVEPSIFAAAPADPIPLLHMLKKNWDLVDFYSQKCMSTLFYLSRKRHRCHNFQYFAQNLQFFREKNTVYLPSLSDIDTIPDPNPASDRAGPGWGSRSDKIMPIQADLFPQHNLDGSSHSCQISSICLRGPIYPGKLSSDFSKEKLSYTLQSMIFILLAALQYLLQM